jgi:hypothetical protein
MSDKLEAKLQPVAESLLAPDETLAGCCVATQTSLFKGRMVALAVTADRIVVQGLTRRFEPDGEPLSLTPDRIAEAGVDGAGGGWITLNAAIMDRAAVTLKLRTTDGEKLKLMMMRSGDEVQRTGVAALGEWFARNA